MKNNLELKGISFSYRNKRALDKITLSLSEGIYGLIGPNGSGKSTLIDIICTHLKPQTGELLWNDRIVNQKSSTYFNGIGLVPQALKGFSTMRADQFLWYMASLKNLKNMEAKNQIETLAKRVGLDQVLSQKVGSFSGGMRQRLLFIQAMLGDPKIIILDEPTAGLDPSERINLRNLISELASNRILIIATHVMQDIESIADSIIFIKDGQIIFDDSPLKLIKSIEGKVYEKSITKDELNEFRTKYTLCKVTNNNFGYRVRYLDNNLTDTNQAVAANMEDAYLHYVE